MLPCHTAASSLLVSVASIPRSLRAIWLSAIGTFSSAGRRFVPLTATERNREQAEEEEEQEKRTDKDSEVLLTETGSE